MVVNDNVVFVCVMCVEILFVDYWQCWVDVLGVLVFLLLFSNVVLLMFVGGLGVVMLLLYLVEFDVLLLVVEVFYCVLIVEDDCLQVLFVQSVLYGVGMEVLVYVDVEGVQQVIVEYCFDLILMDFYLFGLDGMCLIVLICQQFGQQLLLIVFFSGDFDLECQFEVLDSGVDDFFSKLIWLCYLIVVVFNCICCVRVQVVMLLGVYGVLVMNNFEIGLFMCYYVMQQLVVLLLYCDCGGLYFIEIVSVLGLCECYGYVVFECLMVQVG